MAQMKTMSWTNPATAVAKDVSVGFSVDKVTTIDVTAGGSWMWVYYMPAGYYITLSSGAVTTSNGFTPLEQQGLFGAPITGVTEAADTIFAVSYDSQFDFKVGDVVKIGDKLIVMEAMKMENNINADKEGTISAIKVNTGDSVLEGEALVEIGS